MRIQARIVDAEFAHSPSITWSHIPKDMEWIREGPTDGVVFFTERKLPEGRVTQCRRKIALLIEPGVHLYMQSNFELLDTFDFVLTYNRNLLDMLGDRGLFYPFGGTWIQESQQQIYTKTKSVSLLSSAKLNGCFGYHLRHASAKLLPLDDVYGMVRNPPRPVEWKTEALKDYRFSVIIENMKFNDWFSEKLIDPFRCGTIPIYWGTDNVGNYFNTNGILSFGKGENRESDLKELSVILNDVATETFYNDHIEAVQDNFDRSASYLCTEDWITAHYPWLFV